MSRVNIEFKARCHNPDKIRRIGINKEAFVTPCNNIVGVSNFDINFEWYEKEVEKLIFYARKT